MPSEPGGNGPPDNPWAATGSEEIWAGPRIRGRDSRRRRLRPLRWTVATVVVAGLATAGVVVALNHLDRTQPVVEGCAAVADGEPWVLSTAQADNAALIAVTALHRGLPARAASIGLATALQESKMLNIDYGDRDSVGLFQQRPSQGWGTVEQIMDPVYSTNAFYDVLVTIDGYEDMELTDAAQAVQRSGFPDAYAQHEDRSRAWASALTGYSPASLTCTLAPVGAEPGASSTGDPAPLVDALHARLERDVPGLPATVDGASLLVDARPLAAGAGTGGGPAETRVAWAVGQWAVAVARSTDVVRVDVADRSWSRGVDGWTAIGATGGPESSASPGEGVPVPAGQVRITVATPSA